MNIPNYSNDSYLKQRLNCAGKSPYEDEDTEPDWLNDDLGSDDTHDQEFDLTDPEDEDDES